MGQSVNVSECQCSKGLKRQVQRSRFNGQVGVVPGDLCQSSLPKFLIGNPVSFSAAALFLLFSSIALLLCLLSLPNYAHAATIDLPQTGQTTCYNASGNPIACAGTGQDGEKLQGVSWPSSRFTDNGNGTMTDNLTGLIWLRYTNCTSITRNWTTALSDVASLNTNGKMNNNDCVDTSNGGSHQTDWRLPNINELESLLHAEKSDISAWLGEQGFWGVQNFSYWSSTTYAGSKNSAWYVHTGNGIVSYAGKSGNLKYVWPVRGTTTGPAKVWKTGQTACYDVDGNGIACAGTGQDGEKLQGEAWPNPRYDASLNNGTVTDNLTGLIWLKNASCFGAKGWANALNDANTLTSGNCGLTDGSQAGDWRLPNRKELMSLIDRSEPEAPNTLAVYFWNPSTSVQASSYWSSSTNANSTAYAWFVHMGEGYVDGGFKTNIIPYVWPVRGGSKYSAASANPASKDFGSVNNGSSAAQTFTITNNGTNNLYITTVSITGADSGQFSKSNDTCANQTIAPAGTCTVDVTFNPASAGAKSATLNIASAPSIDIALSGTGVQQYTLTVTGTGSNSTGNVTGGQTINCDIAADGSASGTCSEVRNAGAAIALTATPAANTTVTWTNCDTAVGNGCTLTLNSNTTVNAQFVLNTYTVTASAAGNGTGTVASNVGGISYTYQTNNTGTTSALNHGTNVILTATAGAGSTVSWTTCTGTTGGTTAVATCTYNNLDANKTAEATFTLNQYTVTPSAGANGTITPNIAQTVNHGSTTQFTVTPEAGYTASVGGTCGGNLAGTTYTTNAITANCTVTATFTVIPAPEPDPEPQPQSDPQPDPQPQPQPEPQVINNNDPSINYSFGWHGSVNPNAASGNLTFGSNVGGTGASVSFTFTGSSIQWRAMMSPHGGTARVYIDGIYIEKASLQSGNTAFDANVFNWSGSNGSHTITIVLEPALPGFSVNIDRFIVQ